MGVDFFPCDYCGQSVCDCGNYEYCNDKCYRRWCNKKCAEGDGYKRDEDDAGEYIKSCKFCRDEDAENHELFKFLLNKYKLKREDVVKEYFGK